MAAGAIIAALANIPWGQVVDNAPKLAEGAARLMRAVTGLRKPSETAADTASPSPPEPRSEMQALQREVEVLRDTVAGLQEQMQVSSLLLKNLTEQNIQLIQRVELNRLRLRSVSMALVGVLLASIVVAVYLFMHST